MLWKEGMPSWKPLSELPQLREKLLGTDFSSLSYKFFLENDEKPQKLNKIIKTTKL